MADGVSNPPIHKNLNESHFRRRTSGQECMHQYYQSCDEFIDCSTLFMLKSDSLKALQFAHDHDTIKLQYLVICKQCAVTLISTPRYTDRFGQQLRRISFQCEHPTYLFCENPSVLVFVALWGSLASFPKIGKLLSRAYWKLILRAMRDLLKLLDSMFSKYFTDDLEFIENGFVTQVGDERFNRILAHRMLRQWQDERLISTCYSFMFRVLTMSWTFTTKHWAFLAKHDMFLLMSKAAYFEHSLNTSGVPRIAFGGTS